VGKDGVIYSFRGGVALETQFYPDAVNHPEWPSPVVKAGTPYRSETLYKFS
jgi:aldose 1-epimerase